MDKTLQEWEQYTADKSVVPGMDSNGRSTATVSYAGRSESWTYWLNIDKWVYND